MTSSRLPAFRFGIVAPFQPDPAAWREQVRRIAGQGYSTVLVPDFPLAQPAPAPALAVAATVADVRVGTWVYAAPLRAPWLTAWEAHSLTVLTDGRFEMGIGVGRPDIENELADIVTFAMTPNEPRVDVTQRVRDFRTARQVELSMHIPVVGSTVSPFMAPPDTDTSALHAADSLAYLSSDPSAAADELRRRREEMGLSYFAFGANNADTFAPLVAELSGA
ncbi:LLM class flavin-dependent oxidoreductase [uncultured Jatrophihabitans sp.]|uniref:LLM class flavin-dependent oxidoreductase n=1 Tax=uncultured Jatrophihabitans sp. TaxID=1610747 RepID=UPI0035CAB960